MVYYTAEQDGLTKPWAGRVFLNPPGGLVAPFWVKLMDAYASGEVFAAIWLGYSLEQLQTLQRVKAARWLPQDFPLCIPARRIAFLENETRLAARIERLAADGKGRVPRAAPSHANYLAYLGRTPDRFAAEFGSLGTVFNANRIL